MSRALGPRPPLAVGNAAIAWTLMCATRRIDISPA